MKKYKISLVLNLIIFIFVAFATVSMYLGFEFMGHSESLTAESVKMLQFYTVQSNLLMGIMALVFVIYDILVISKKVSEIPSAVYLLKLTFTLGVAVTFFTVVCYLAPAVGSKFLTLFINSNLFFHLLVPLLAMIVFLAFERTNKIRFAFTPLCLIPTLIYGVYYCINALTHMVDGVVPYEYDWYGFAQGGVGGTIVVFMVMIAVAYVLTLILWAINRKKDKAM